MSVDLDENDTSIRVALLFIIIILFAGLSGLIACISLMILSKVRVGRDSIFKHGVSTGNSRLGGIAIIISLVFGVIAHLYLNELLTIENLKKQIDFILILSFFIGLIGLTEDIKQRLSSTSRLLVIIIILALGLFYVPEILPQKLPLFSIFDHESTFYLSYFMTLFMVCGYINAGNIADGANGLLAIIYLVFFIIIYTLDQSIFNFSMIISLLSFSIYNISTGRIFLGDFGAYFLSSLVALSSLKIYSNFDVSIFFFATILIYPCFEITRSLILRFINKNSIMGPDNNHLHNFLYDYFLSKRYSKHNSNSLTGVLLAISTSAPTLILYINNVGLNSRLWIYLFVTEMICLVYAYSYFSQKNETLKKSSN
jgi:UDP-GlcNAc:undecaprenyl-phosphate/decaprenyl-phosphate GlcNAc-1-phosphate transferase